jgi:hypothetical protein
VLFGGLDKHMDSLVRLAALPLVLWAVFSLITNLIAELPPLAVLGLFCFMLVLSPIAYFVREELEGRPRRQGAPRGAERTPLVPPVMEDE